MSLEVIISGDGASKLTADQLKKLLAPYKFDIDCVLNNQSIKVRIYPPFKYSKLIKFDTTKFKFSPDYTSSSFVIYTKHPCEKVNELIQLISKSLPIYILYAEKECPSERGPTQSWIVKLDNESCYNFKNLKCEEILYKLTYSSYKKYKLFYDKPYPLYICDPSKFIKNQPIVDDKQIITFESYDDLGNTIPDIKNECYKFAVPFFIMTNKLYKKQFCKKANCTENQLFIDESINMKQQKDDSQHHDIENIFEEHHIDGELKNILEILVEDEPDLDPSSPTFINDLFAKISEDALDIFNELVLIAPDTCCDDMIEYINTL